MNVHGIFARLIGSEKAGQHLLIAILVLLTAGLMIVWGFQMDQEGRLAIIRMLMYALALLVPFGLGMAGLQEIMRERIGGLEITTKTVGNATIKTQRPVLQPAVVSDEEVQAQGKGWVSDLMQRAQEAPPGELQPAPDEFGDPIEPGTAGKKYQGGD